MGGQRCFQHAGQTYYGDVLERENGSVVRHGQGLQIMSADTVKGGGSVTFSLAVPSVDWPGVSASAAAALTASLADAVAAEAGAGAGVEVVAERVEVSLPAEGDEGTIRVVVSPPTGVSSSALRSALGASASLPGAVASRLTSALPELASSLAADSVTVGELATPDPGIVWGQYKGTWKDNLMNGTGMYQWSDGSRYEGNFRDGNLHGHGRLQWPEGSFYDGDWAYGEMTGQGEFFNAFNGIRHHGLFYRNCLQLHNGSWVDMAKEREKFRRERLQIGAGGPKPEAGMPVIRCSPADLASWLDTVRQEPPFLVPLILADTNCPEAGEGQGPAPLWCLEAGQHGCTPATAVHIAFAAAEKRQKRDYKQLFRNAIREALLTFRPFALIFGNRQNSFEPLQPSDSLTEFLDPLSLPQDLFDLRHFHASGAVETFLPPEKVGGSVTSALLPPLPGTVADVPSAAEPVAASGTAAAESRAGSKQDSQAEAMSARSRRKAVPPPTAYLLNFALVCLGRVDAGMRDEDVRAHLGRLFAAQLPLHRVAAVVVGAGDAA